MFRSLLAVALLTCLGNIAYGQSADTADHRSFELAPVAPPQPALKYQLRFDDLADRLNGNAAILYLHAVLLMGPDAKDRAARALEAYDAKDMATFNSLADELNMSTVLDELELAGRREECEWQAPFRERGAYTLLPQLEPIAHGLTRLVKTKALRQIGQGETEAALLTLRLGYEMSDKVGREPTMVSSLVSLAILAQMNDALVQLMNRPESPNLYSALRGFPARQPIFCRAMDSERSFVAPSIPNFMRLRGGEELTADEWRKLNSDVWTVIDGVTGSAQPPQHADPVQAATAETRRRAEQEYARMHRMTEAQVSKLDPVIVLGNFYYRQFVVLFDEQYKLRGLPYPDSLSKAKQLSDQAVKIQTEQPENPFQVYGFEPSVRRFAVADRQLAALATVEAIRSYAAANSGRLPGKLQDVTDTPVPQNPATGKAFEYSVKDGVAMLSDSQFEPQLNYSIKIRP